MKLIKNKATITIKKKKLDTKTLKKNFKIDT